MMPQATERSLAPVTPLAGVRVLDFTRILSGPYCTLVLAELGADVIKIERSDRGDDTRSWGPPFLDNKATISTYFAAMNRGKRSVAVDLRAAGAPSLLARLASEVDVVIENFRPGVGEQLGLDWASLSRLNPDIVLCSISGFNGSGPYADLPATEIVVEGMSGLMEITGAAEGPPVRFGVAMIDVATGLTAATQIVASLLVARETGAGRHIRCALYGTALSVLSTLITSYATTGEEPTRWGSHHPTVVPYGGYATKDGYLITGVINDSTWPAFCEALDLGQLLQRAELSTNAGRVTSRGEVNAAIESVTITDTTVHWINRLRARGLLAAPVRKVSEAANELDVLASTSTVALAGYPAVRVPTLTSEYVHQHSQHVPRLGEDSVGVLQELLGMSSDDVQHLIASAVIAEPAALVR